MQGKVKWFSEEKGYGFVTDEALVDRHFGVRDVIGAELPTVGAVIQFEPATGEKGPRAKQVKIISQPPLAKKNISTHSSAASRDDRVTCRSCSKKMVPRIITHKGDVQKSVCPYCGSTHKRFFNWIWWIFVVIAIGFILYS